MSAEWSDAYVDWLVSYAAETDTGSRNLPATEQDVPTRPCEALGGPPGDGEAWEGVQRARRAQRATERATASA